MIFCVYSCQYVFTFPSSPFPSGFSSLVPFSLALPSDFCVRRRALCRHKRNPRRLSAANGLPRTYLFLFHKITFNNQKKTKKHFFLQKLTASPSGPVTLAASFPLSPKTTSNSTTSPSPTDRTAFFGLFFMIAVWCTNTSSLVSLRLMKP